MELSPPYFTDLMSALFYAFSATKVTAETEVVILLDSN